MLVLLELLRPLVVVHVRCWLFPQRHIGTMGFMLASKVPAEIAQNLYYDGQLDVPTWPMKVAFAFGVATFLLRLAINTQRHFITAIQRKY